MVLKQAVYLFIAVLMGFGRFLADGLFCPKQKLYTLKIDFSQ